MSLKSKYKLEKLKEFLNNMILIRRFEEKAGQLYGLRKIKGFCHLYIGQEAVAVAAVATMKKGVDSLFTGYRDHGFALLLGSTPNTAMAELYGKATGSSRGKGGSMHYFSKEHNFYGGNGIVGGQIPMAAGAALAQKYKGEGVTLCFFGDGAIHQGAFFETINMASLWNLPIIFICENNEYAMGTAINRASSQPDFAKMVEPHGLKCKTINGMDVIEVYEELGKSVEEVRKNNKPQFFNIITYRYKGHSMSDPETYRTKEEIEEHKKSDPILILREKLLSEKLISEEEYIQMDNVIKEIIKECVVFAEESPEPDFSQIYKDVYANE